MARIKTTDCRNDDVWLVQENASDIMDCIINSEDNGHRTYWVELTTLSGRVIHFNLDHVIAIEDR